MKRRMLITGASAGIGAACAREWAARGWDLLLVARRTEPMQALAQELSSTHGTSVEIMSSDLSDPAAPDQLANAIESAGLQIDGIINNAGYGVPGSFTSVPWETHADFLRVLLWAPTELSYRLLPAMQARGFGRIVNIASLAGLMPGTAGHTLYGATKSYLIRYSQSLAQEVRSKGVHVTALCPGFTYSEFHDVNGMRESVSKMPKLLWMDAATVAAQAFDAVERGQMICVNGRVNRFLAVLARWLPQSWALKLMGGQARRFRRQ